MSRGCVLDASALLCLLRDEPGSEAVAAVMPNAVISAVNLSEAVAKLAEVGMNAADIDQTLAPLQLKVLAFDQDAAIAAGLLRPATRSVGLSFGDRACIALANKLGGEALTTDRAWARLDVGVVIKLAR